MAKILDKGKIFEQVQIQMVYTGNSCGNTYSQCGFFYDLEGEHSKDVDFYCFLFDERINGERCKQCKGVAQGE